MRKSIALFFLALYAAAGIAIPSPSVSYACSCADVQPDEALAGAKLVFAGEVLRVKEQQRPAGILGPIEYREANQFKVTALWKGVDQSEQIVFDNGSESSCGIDFKVGTRYLVYAYQERNGDAYTGLCSAKELAAAGDDLRMLGPGSEPQRIVDLDGDMRWLFIQDYGVVLLLGVLGLVVLLIAASLTWRRRRKKQA
ncbi:hypothetical protein ACFFSY_30825 [Paenibacillus aurantiacus]|uniref:Tissue inhibitor of metalloproteinase n=1 Tax=Paenibacillus aurantiacus TaxID=1936118 RepID=A0ABV5KYR7_9BACL